MSQVRRLLISGRIVLPDGGARQRYLLIADGKIEWISRSRPPSHLVADALEVVTGPQDWIFPGLIDLHTHATYNLLPLWRSRRAPFDHRYVWRDDDGYRKEIRGVLRKIDGHSNARKVFSELQAVAGGTCLMEQPYPLDAEDGSSTLLCRDTGTPSDLGLPADRHIHSVVDFFRPDDDGLPAEAQGYNGKPGALARYVAQRAVLQATLVHLGEGRSGFGSHRGVDPYTRAEVEALINHPAMEDVAAVRASRLSIIHGCGIDVTDERHLNFLVDRGISIIWSPASNMLLYDDTLDVEALIQRGVNVALGSDWSPSGSKHVWDEAKFARFFLNAIGANISDADIFKMVTTHPGRAIGLPKLGRIEEGSPADFFILRSPVESDSALEVFFSTTDRDVLATIVGGVPVYGDRQFLETFGHPLQPLPAREGSAVENKAVHLPSSIGVDDFAGEITAVENQLKALTPPVFRSNLLVDSDVPYQRRLHMLRSRVERFGWTVKRWRKLKSNPQVDPPARVRSPAGAIKMHIYNTSGDSTEPADSLAATRWPAVVGLEQPLGLAAFLGALLPESRPEGCPKAISLCAYPSVKSRDQVMRSVAGRTSRLAQSGEPAHPTAYTSATTGEGIWFLYDQPADWAIGMVRVNVTAKHPEVESATFVAAAHELLADMQREPRGRDASVAVVASNFLVFWEHVSTDELPAEVDLSMGGMATPVTCQVATRMDAKAGLTATWPGLNLEDHTCVQLVFERRELFPW